MDEAHNNRSFFDRRILIVLIVLLALVQAGILAYLWGLLQPAAPPEAAGATPTSLYQWPSLGTAVPDGTIPTPLPTVEDVVVGPPVSAADHAALARAFDVERALEHLAYLASDELGGRQPGTPGGWAAGDYIAAHFAAYGLEPAGENDTYFQAFTVPYGRITELPILTVSLTGGEPLTHTYAYRTDYRALTSGYLGAGEGQGPVVWLNECRHDDYAGLDVAGKIVMCRYTRDPEVYRQAIEHQVGGLLLLDREQAGEPFRRGGYRETAWVPETIPAYLISEAVAWDLLTGSDYTLDDLSLRFTATPLSTTVWMAVTLEEQEAVTARNVLALLPGADPEWDDEIVVIGAHYDHLGREPDGAIINGANDNASGVSTVLEIARLWQARDFHPARSVLFAAWDGEEQGLLGSHYYVEHPALPLTRTIAMLNLDMVGRGEALQIDGEGDVAAQLRASAQAYGVTSTVTFMGRSDHASFYEAGIPAAMYIWWPDDVYHTVGDEAEAIEPDKLRAAGVLSVHTLTALAEGRVELEQAVERLRASIAAGDREAFLAGLDSTDPGLMAAQAAWFDNLWARELTWLDIEPEQMRIGAGEAHVTLRLTYRWAGAARRTPSVSYDVRFVQRDGVWACAGYELDTLSGDVVTVARFPDVHVETRQLLTTTQDAYLALAADLGVEPVTGTRFVYYPDGATMRAIARPAADHDTGWLVSSAGLAEIAWGQPITPALVNLALNQVGLPPQASETAWLREGLALHYADGVEREYLPVLAASDVLTPLLEFPALSGLPESEAQALRGAAWSGTEYLLDRYGLDGLRRLCAAWGAGDADAAFRDALGLSPARFEAAWRADRLAPLRADAGDIQAAVAARVAAVLDGDAAGFLATVNPADPILCAEERNWFADLAGRPIISYTVTAEVVGWSPKGDEAVVALNVSSAISGEQAIHVAYDARFVRRFVRRSVRRSVRRWFYAGVAWPNERASAHFVLEYQDHDEAWAQHVLGLAEAAYDQVVADLDMTLPLPQEIKLYDDSLLFRASISPAPLDGVSGWTGPGEGVRLWLREDTERFIQSAIAHELTRQALFAQGLEADWLHEGAASLTFLLEGVADFEAGRVLPLGGHWMAGRYNSIVQDGIHRHEEFPLDALPAWEDVPDGRAALFRAQSWSLVSFIAERYGLPGLRRFIAQSIASDDAVANLRAALGVAPDSFLAEWREYVRIAGTPDDLVSLAQRFDPERALAHVAVLSGPEFGGREAGAPGADRAANYIAGQFAALGLEPLEVVAREAVTESADLDYLQWFPISYTHLVSVPAFTLLDGDDTVLYRFVYRDDFVENAGGGIAQGELVWVHTQDLGGMRFGGAVVLEREVDDPVARAAQLQEHGAGGLVIVSDEESFDIRTGRVHRFPRSEATIPVFEITDVALDALLERLGMQRTDLAFAPPALPLGAQARQTLVCLPITTTLTANVVGVWPGSDPDLADEVLVVGAHYDHVGQTPDGLYFPGANRNASGVAALLEMARVWRAAGYHPARSVLFVAWGGEVLESAGVEYYLAHPVVPLTQTVGVIALDSIAGGKGYKLLFFGEQDHALPLIQPLEAGAARLERRAWHRGSAGAGWQTLFSSEGIPTVKLIWAEAEEGSDPLADTVARIDLDRLANSGEILTLTVSWLAGR